MEPIMEWRQGITCHIADIADPNATAVMNTFGWFGVRWCPDDDGDFWTITHLPTGTLVGGTDDETDAKAIAVALCGLDCVDWSNTEASYYLPFREQIVEIARKAAGGEERCYISGESVTQTTDVVTTEEV